MGVWSLKFKVVSYFFIKNLEYVKLNLFLVYFLPNTCNLDYFSPGGWIKRQNGENVWDITIKPNQCLNLEPPRLYIIIVKIQVINNNLHLGLYSNKLSLESTLRSLHSLNCPTPLYPSPQFHQRHSPFDAWVTWMKSSIFELPYRNSSMWSCFCINLHWFDIFLLSLFFLDVLWKIRATY